MAVTIPTTAELAAQILADIELKVNQTTPANDKAFNRVIAGADAGLSTMHYKYAVDRLLQTLALTATDADLDRIGINYGVYRKAAVAAVIEVRQSITFGNSVPATVDYTSDSSGVIYNVGVATPAVPGDYAIVEVTAEEAGESGNAASGDTFTISRQITGILSTTADYESTVTLGTDKETDTAYRRRILQEIRTAGGGGSGVDYKSWAEEVVGVSRAFPFAIAPPYIPPLGSSNGTTKLKDSNMELAGTTYWSGTSIAKATSTPTPQEGTQCLKVTSTTVLANTGAYQESLIVGRYYDLMGYAYSDGSAVPEIRSGDTIIWTGTATASWQNVYANFLVAGSSPLDISTTLSFGIAAGSTPGQWVAYDNMRLYFSLSSSRPGDRTVYIESTTAVDPDGVPPQSLLDSVRTALNTDPTTGQARMALGLTDEKLFVEPIQRKEFDVEITGLVVDAAQETALKASLDTGIDEYLRSVQPYAEGVDSVLERNDTITSVTLSEVMQSILKSYGASATGVTFTYLAVGPQTTYTLATGELGKLGVITYV